MAFGEHYGLREYDRDRAAGAIVEGDEPATWRDRLAALESGTRTLDGSALDWARGTLADGGVALCWTELHGMRKCTSVQAWNAAHAARGTPSRSDA